LLSQILWRCGAMTPVLRTVLVLLTLGMLSACGGGGGGGGGDGPPAGAFTLAASSTEFTVLQNQAPPASRSFALTVTGPNVTYVGAAYTGGQTQPGWLGIDIVGSGTSYNLVVRILTTSLPAGNYSSTFQVGTADSRGNVLQQRSFTVTYTVNGALALSATPQRADFIFGDTRTTATVTLNVQGTGRQWSLSSSAPWLQVPAGTQTGSANLSGTIDVDDLAPGTYTATVRATSATGASDTASTDVTVVVAPATFSVAEDAVLLGGSDGRSSILQQTVHFTLAAGNGVHPYTIALTTDDGGSWLSADLLNGNVGNAGAMVTLSASRSGLTGGTRTGQLRISVDVKGTTLTEVLPVTFNTEANRIITTTSGVGFSSVPGRDVLTRRVKVLNNLGRTDVPWTASANQAWLSVTATGITGGDLVVTANPAGLSTDTTHFAEVTVTSPDATVENQQTIRVGLHVASSAPATVIVAANTAFLAASPVEPVVAVNDGASGSVELRDFHSGALVRTLANVVARAGGMTWSGDGRTLFVHDSANLRVAALSPVTGALLASYDASNAFGGASTGLAVAYVRTAGFPMLVTPGSRIYDLTTGTGRVIPTFGIATSAVSLAVSPDQSLVVPDFGAVKRLERSALDGGLLLVSDAAGFTTAQGRAGEACVSADGERIYTASGSPYEFPASSAATGAVVQRLPASNYPNSIQCVWNGLVVGGIDGFYAENDIWVYDGPSGAGLAQYSSSGTGGAYRSLIDRGIAVSADGARVVSAARLSGQAVSQLYFRSLPAPP
jgi:hypothetical protein